jgi:transposase
LENARLPGLLGWDQNKVKVPTLTSKSTTLGWATRRLDQDLAERYGIEMIAPHRGLRREPTQDGSALRRYRKRWRVERLFAWLHHFRRLVIRWEYHVENFLGMVRLGCIALLLRQL